MKNLIFGVIVLSLISCNSSDTGTSKMPGAYFMTSQTVNDGKKDTRYTDLKQLKIYTDNFMMYTQVNPSDSASAFGVGTYNSDSGGVVENVIYSARDTSFSNGPSRFKLDVTKTPDGYEQVIPEIVTDSQKYKLTEVYQSVGTTAKTPLDGVWKETNSYIIHGKDTMKNVRTQFKTFYAGYFMFGHTLTDSASKKRTNIGFGTFTWVNNNKIKETDLNSTYSINAGQSFDIDIEMTGKDKYKQTISGTDGSKSVEYYERLKK
ncbi:MAG: hypothetical protein M3Z26_02005 [Bacteroidota bacterium]|nr:hypothetical protein [Bacteroidota bacterium]